MSIYVLHIFFTYTLTRINVIFISFLYLIEWKVLHSVHTLKKIAITSKYLFYAVPWPFYQQCKVYNFVLEILPLKRSPTLWTLMTLFSLTILLIIIPAQNQHKKVEQRMKRERNKPWNNQTKYWQCSYICLQSKEQA